MSNLSVLKAEIRPDSPYVSCLLNTSDGSAIYKTLTVGDFVNLLSSSEGASKYEPIPDLPMGYISGAMSPVGADTFKVFVSVPPALQAIQYHGKPFLVPFPALILEFVSHRGAITETHCWAYDSKKDKAITDSTVLYQYPFGNVNTDGRVCWGRNAERKVARMKDVEQYVSLFINSDSNDDYFSIGTHVLPWKEGLKSGQVSVLLKYLEGKKNFPSKLLVERTTFGKVRGY